MTSGGVLHVITGLETGGAEMLVLELCRAEICRGREYSVASLISDGPMRQRFAQIGVNVVGLGMKRGEFVAPGLFRLVRLIRRVRPRIVRGWLYHGVGQRGGAQFSPDGRASSCGSVGIHCLRLST